MRAAAISLNAALTGVATAGTLAAPARGLDECIELPPENAETFNTTSQY